MEGRKNQGTWERVIAHAVVAGGLRQAVREHPEAARGLAKAADFYSAKVRALADEIATTRTGWQACAGRRA